MSQLLLPIADQTVGSYTTAPIWSQIDDGLTPNDTDFGSSPTQAGGIGSNTNTYVATLSTGADPGAGFTTGYSLVCRAKYTASSGKTATVNFNLLDSSGGSLGISSGSLSMTTSFADYTVTLTPTQITALRGAGFTNLRLAASAQVASGTFGNISLQISNMYLLVPDVPQTPSGLYVVRQSIQRVAVR